MAKMEKRYNKKKFYFTITSNGKNRKGTTNKKNLKKVQTKKKIKKRYNQKKPNLFYKSIH